MNQPNGAQTGCACVGMLVVMSAFSALGAWIFMLLYNWLTPSLFPGAVESGSLAGSISFWVALGVCCLLSFIGGFFRAIIAAKQD